VKFAPADSTILVTASHAGEEIHLHVEDEGPGVDDQQKDRIFDRFYRGDFTAGGPPGSGLGLAIVKSVVERHGGSVSVRKNRKGGTTFTTRFPAESSAGIPGSLPG